MRGIPAVDFQPNMTGARQIIGVLLGVLMMAVFAFCMLQDARAVHVQHLIGTSNVTIAAPSAETQLLWSGLSAEEAPAIEQRGAQTLYHFNNPFQRITEFKLPLLYELRGQHILTSTKELVPEAKLHSNGNVNVSASFSDNAADIIYGLFNSHLSAKEHGGPWHFTPFRPSHRETTKQDRGIYKVHHYAPEHLQALACILLLLCSVVPVVPAVAVNLQHPGD
jgi:hypothetical protein